MKFISSLIIFILLVSSITYSAMSFSDEENEQILHATLYKLDSESDSDESSKNTSCNALSDDEEITKLVMVQPWAVTAQKIISTMTVG